MRLVDAETIVELYREFLKGYFESRLAPCDVVGVDTSLIDMNIEIFKQFLNCVPIVENKDAKACQRIFDDGFYQGYLECRNKVVSAL